MTSLIDKIVSQVGFLDEEGHKPRVHGNGFLQFDLSPTQRLHVWSEELPKQKTPSSIHDHIFDMESTILCGALKQIEYAIEIDPEGDFDLLMAQAQPDTNNTILAPVGSRVNCYVAGMETVYPGQTYTFPAFSFHDTVCTELTATLMTKIPTGAGRKPRVLVKHDQTPDNDFDREGFDPKVLWPVLYKALDAAVKQFPTPDDLKGSPA